MPFISMCGVTDGDRDQVERHLPEANCACHPLGHKTRDLPQLCLHRTSQLPNGRSLVWTFPRGGVAFRPHALGGTDEAAWDGLLGSVWVPPL